MKALDLGVLFMNRRNWIAGSITGLVGLGHANSKASSAPLGLDIIDCHTHFYDPMRPEGIPWPEKGTSLYRTVLPKDLRALKQFRPVTGTVIVEASSRLEDNQWLLDIAKDDPFIVGIVGRLEPATKEFGNQVKRFAANPLFRGIRVSSDLVASLLEKGTLGDLKVVADSDLALDVNGGPETPAILAKLAKKLPSLRIVLNHIGNVRITSEGPPLAWREGIQKAALNKNIFCKVSALVEGATRDGKRPPKDLAFYRPYLNIVWNAFGYERVIYGSNWPVSELAATYGTLQQIVMEYAFEKGGNTLERFCSLNAKQAYKWVERPGRRG